MPFCNLFMGRPSYVFITSTEFSIRIYDWW